MIRGGILLAAIGLLTAAATPTASMPSVNQRATAICSAPSLTITFDGKRVTVTAGAKILARTTSMTRSISSSCQRTDRRGFNRWNLRTDGGRHTTVSCDTTQKTLIETEPVRSSSGRIVGSRLAVWRSVYFNGVGEIAEGVVGTRHPWFSYYSTYCHTA